MNNSPVDAFRQTINQPGYGTVYAFNQVLAPLFVRLANQQFRYVEEATKEKTYRDSHNAAYNHHEITIYTSPKDSLDKPLMVAFVEALGRDMEGKIDFLSWRIKPRIDFRDEPIDGKVFKVYTMKASFTCR